MADVFREVDEEVRQDQITLALARNWGWILLAGLLIVAGVAAWRGYEYWTLQNQEAAGGRYLDALKLDRDGKGADGLTALQDLSRTGTPGYALLARFRAAGQIGRTDPAGAARAFDALASDPKVEPALQDVARLRAATLLLDTADLKTIQDRLHPLADANSAMRNPAREVLALAALKADDNAAAAEALDAILADPTASQTARQRAQALRGLTRSGAAAAAKP
jgi:hypothetical protein